MPAPIEFRNFPIRFRDALDAGRHRAIPDRVIDGDSYVFCVDFGADLFTYVHVRLRGIDTPELRGKETTEESRAVAREARDFCDELLFRSQTEGQPTPCLLYLTGKESIGRYEGDVFLWAEFREEWHSLAPMLHVAGYEKVVTPAGAALWRRKAA